MTQTTTQTTRTVARSQSGRPCLWEAGGSSTNTGNAVIVAGPEGERLSPIYVRRAGSLACAEHAMMPVEVGCLVIEASHHRRDYDVAVCRIIAVDGDTATLELAHQYEQGEWDRSPAEALEAVIDAAREKAACYHCREPHYAAV